MLARERLQENVHKGLYMNKHLLSYMRMSKQTYYVYSSVQKHMCMYGAVVHEFTNADTDKHYFSLAWPCERWAMWCECSMTLSAGIQN